LRAAGRSNPAGKEQRRGDAVACTNVEYQFDSSGALDHVLDDRWNHFYQSFQLFDLQPCRHREP
jgi:hypothetical protein